MKVIGYNHVKCLAQYLAHKEHATNLTSIGGNIIIIFYTF